MPPKKDDNEPIRRGRPKGSKNKAKATPTTTTKPQTAAFGQYQQEKAQQSVDQQDVDNATEKTAGMNPQQLFEHRKSDLIAKRDERFEDHQAARTLTMALKEYNVCICNYKTDQAPMTELAGYLNLKSTKEIEGVILEHPVVGGCLRELRRLHQPDTNYGMLKSVKVKFEVSKLFKLLADGRTFTQAAIDGDDEPDGSVYPTEGTSLVRMYLFFMRQAKKAINALPAVFTGGFPECPEQEYFGCCAEDIHRFAALWYMHKKDTKAGRSANDDGGSKKPKLPVLPMFCHPDKVVINTAEQSARNQRALQAMLRTDLTDEEFIRGAQAGRAGFDPSVADEDDDRPFGDVYIRDDLPILEPEDKKQLMSNIASFVSVLYEDASKSNRLLAPDEVMVAAAQKHESSHANQLASIEDDTNQEAMSQAATTDFIKMQQYLNHRSARAPDWDECVRVLKLKIVDEPSKLSKLPFKVLFRGIELLPWQAAAATFIFKMMESIGTCIDADDVGLGKTISVLAAIVRWSEHIEDRRLEWRAQYDRKLAEARELWSSEHAGTLDEAKLLDMAKNIRGELGEEPVHRPVLVVFPLAGMTAWARDAARFTDAVQGNDITVKRFYGLRGAKARVNNAIPDAAALIAQCEQMDPSDPRTSRTLIMATYFSFHSRTLCDENGALLSDRSMGLRRKQKQAQPTEADGSDAEQAVTEGSSDDQDGDRPRDRTADSPADDGKVDWEETMDEATASREAEYTYEVTHEVQSTHLNIPTWLFGAVVYDEAHRIKNPASLQAKALGMLSCPSVMCTATPAVPTARDLYGLLSVAWSNVRGRIQHLQDAPTVQSFVENFERFEHDYHLDLFQIPPEARYIYLAALDPDVFRSHITTTAAKNPEITTAIMPLTIALICLRRTMGEEIQVHGGLKIQIGAQIPMFHIVHVELRQGPFGDAFYQTIHREVMAAQTSEAVSDDPQALLMKLKRRTLQRATHNRLLVQYQARAAGEEATSIKDLQKRGLDSFDLLFKHTKESLQMLPCTDRISMAFYICRPSAKSCFMVRELLEVVVRGGEKMIIWAHWPDTLMLCELICTILQINFLSIRSGKSLMKRAEAETAYNENVEMKVLICGSRSAAESLNLQFGGWRQLVMDLVPIPTLMQMVGRGFRFGQKHEQIIKVLVVDETYDQHIQAVNLTNYRGLVAATAHPNFDRDTASLVDRAFDQRQMEKSNNPEQYRAYLMSKARTAHLDALIRSLLGLRSDRHDWLETKDKSPRSKNMLPVERLFRLAGGGDVAQSMVKQIDDANAGIDVSAEPTSLTPFSSMMYLRPGVAKLVDNERIAREMLKAADELVEGNEGYRLHELDAASILEHCKAWADLTIHTDHALVLYRQRNEQPRDSGGEASNHGSQSSLSHRAKTDVRIEQAPKSTPPGNEAPTQQTPGAPVRPQTPPPVNGKRERGELTPTQQRGDDKRMRVSNERSSDDDQVSLPAEVRAAAKPAAKSSTSDNTSDGEDGEDHDNEQLYEHDDDPKAHKLAILRNFRATGNIKDFCDNEFRIRPKEMKRCDVEERVVEIWEAQEATRRGKIDWSKYQAVYKGNMPSSG
ncbi:hypothetical protein LTR17_003341 [Elasticomyces elasticus]|nr:hypothetical protein LTR17_003341 [Elasticomyces elasticus]